jgi:TPR repeat protein
MRTRLASSLLLCLLLSMVAFSQTSALGLNAAQLYEKGMNNLMGVGVSRKDQNAVDYLRRSAELGYPPAQVALGYFYDTGSVVSQDPGQAADWYQKAAKQDDRLAEWLLGRLYYAGNGIPRDLRPQYRRVMASESSKPGGSLWATIAGTRPPGKKRLR